MPSTQPCQRCGAAIAPEDRMQGMCPTCLLELGLREDSLVVVTGAQTPAAPPPSPEELAPLFPQFEILSILGQGGMGVVYKARQKDLDRLVALKVLPTALGRDPAFAERFSREAKALASLSHPNLVAVHNFGKAGDHLWFAMELVDGVNLRQMLRADKIEPTKALEIVGKICDALAYAHSEGVVHRDIKPENILVDKRGRLKITDFGLAKIIGPNEDRDRLTYTQQAMGTPHYMAPEQLEHPDSVDHRADIFSLGVVFYELLTGELPLGRFPVPSQKIEVDVRFDNVVLKALEKEPGRRYQTVADVHTDVDGLGQPASKKEVRASQAAAKAQAKPAKQSSSAGTWMKVLGCMFLLMCMPAIMFLAFILPFANFSSSIDEPVRPTEAFPSTPFGDSEEEFEGEWERAMRAEARAADEGWRKMNEGVRQMEEGMRNMGEDVRNSVEAELRLHETMREMGLDRSGQPTPEPKPTPEPEPTPEPVVKNPSAALVFAGVVPAARIETDQGEVRIERSKIRIGKQRNGVEGILAELWINVSGPSIGASYAAFEELCESYSRRFPSKFDPPTTHVKGASLSVSSLDVWAMTSDVESIQGELAELPRLEAGDDLFAGSSVLQIQKPGSLWMIKRMEVQPGGKRRNKSVEIRFGYKPPGVTPITPTLADHARVEEASEEQLANLREDWLRRVREQVLGVEVDVYEQVVDLVLRLEAADPTTKVVEVEFQGPSSVQREKLVGASLHSDLRVLLEQE